MKITISDIYFLILENKLQDKYDWVYLIKHYELTEEIIEEFKDKMDWFYILKYQKIDQNIFI